MPQKRSRDDLGEDSNSGTPEGELPALKVAQASSSEDEKILKYALEDGQLELSRRILDNHHFKASREDIQDLLNIGSRGNPAILDLLFEQISLFGSSPGSLDIAPVLAAVDNGDVEVCKRLIPHFKACWTQSGENMLIRAIRSGQLEIVKLLVEDGEVDQELALSCSANNSPDILEYLLKKGFDPNFSSYLSSIAGLADSKVALRSAKLLIDAGADVNLGVPLCQIMAKGGNPVLGGYLIERGADLTLLQKERTPDISEKKLQSACKFHNLPSSGTIPEMMQRLIDRCVSSYDDFRSKQIS
eukprot:TRINITY_DN2557_c0_g3_i1.p1 TRINITY_DN2557_c0_g3~~TRINITY_DN2557_c0_g3_i1.p1  ORF type:complete len:301 (+),score=48.65 TRINITY_DN2557_c0_g3_i1:210-1112(+)